MFGLASGAAAETYTIKVWAGGTNENSMYRVDAIEMAADMLQRQAAAQGEDLQITAEKQNWTGWDDFKQALTLAAESGNAPNIIVSGHEDIGPWSASSLLRPIEDYVDFDSWPLNQIYPNLIEIAQYNGQIWGIPQDAEARVFFYSKPALKAIGWTDDQIDSLPDRVQKGEYTLYDMLDDVKKMQDEGAIEPGNGFAPRVNNGPDYWQFYQSFGGEMLDEESGKLIFDEQAMHDMYQFFVDATEKGVVSKTWLGGDWDEWHRAVSAGKYGAWDGGTWHYAQWTKQFGLTDFFDTVQFSLIPQGTKDKGRPNSITHPLVYLLSSAGTDDDAAIAAQLVTIASDPRINALHAVQSAHLAIGENETEIPMYQNDRWLSAASEYLLPHTNAIPNTADFGAYWTAMYKGLESAWTGTSSVDQAVANAKAEVESSLGDKIIIR
ncbi:ABC transporter substrate-binding protein [Consotaella aegiceratis]|uniref:ABC transporter substrate-binding protein n=1 Tax=Consotaella aegiceratis TaxID=3097961 RepID=UPI002F40A99A